MLTSKTDVANIVLGEYKNTEGFGKLFLTAILFNFPYLGFLPYFTQIATVIILSIFLKRYLLLLKSSKDSATNLETRHGPKIVIGFTLLTMAIQAIWIPFEMEIVTIIFLSILYALVSKYKEVPSEKSRNI